MSRVAGASGWGFHSGPRQEGGEQEEEEEREEAKDVGVGVQWRRKGTLLIAPPPQRPIISIYCVSIAGAQSTAPCGPTSASPGMITSQEESERANGN